MQCRLPWNGSACFVCPSLDIITHADHHSCSHFCDILDTNLRCNRLIWSLKQYLPRQPISFVCPGEKHHSHIWRHILWGSLWCPQGAQCCHRHTKGAQCHNWSGMQRFSLLRNDSWHMITGHEPIRKELESIRHLRLEIWKKLWHSSNTYQAHRSCIWLAVIFEDQEMYIQLQKSVLVQNLEIRLPGHLEYSISAQCKKLVHWMKDKRTIARLNPVNKLQGVESKASKILMDVSALRIASLLASALDSSSEVPAMACTNELTWVVLACKNELNGVILYQSEFCSFLRQS